MNDRPTRSSDSFPLITSVVLFVGVALILALVLPRGTGIDTTALRDYRATNTAIAFALLPTATPTRTPTATPTITPTPTSTPIPSATPAPTNTLEPSVAETNAAGAAVAMAAYNPADISAGETLYQATCSACHGMDAHGVQNLGKTLIDSEFALSLSDADLLKFVTTGRPIWDPLNTTGVDMPPRGGNPTLTDDQISQIIAYLRSLQVRAGHTLGAPASAAPAEAATQPPTPAGPQPTKAPFSLPSLDALSDLQPTPLGGAEATEAPFSLPSLDALSDLQPTPLP